MDTLARGGRPKLIKPICESTGCDKPGRTRYPAPSRVFPEPPTYCDACRKRLERSRALECSQPGCRRLRQWNKLKPDRKGFCREHERTYPQGNPVAVQRALEGVVRKVDTTRGCWAWRLTPRQCATGERPILPKSEAITGGAFYVK